MMNKKLVAYFSASGVTKRVAKQIAEIVHGDVLEIEPVEKYTDDDLNWNDQQSRSSKEMADHSYRPAIVLEDLSLDQYDTVLIGFPVWWYTAPTIINTFIESYDFSKQTLIPFCTSGGTGISGCESDLRQSYPKYHWKQGKRLTGHENTLEIQHWINE